VDSSRKHSAMCFLDSRPTLFRDDFRGWLEENFHVYVGFEDLALRLAHSKRHLGAKSLWETLRFQSAIGELSGEWKLNNTYTADCARLAMEMNPILCGMFETRVSPLSRRAA